MMPRQGHPCRLVRHREHHKQAYTLHWPGKPWRSLSSSSSSSQRDRPLVTQRRASVPTEPIVHQLFTAHRQRQQIFWTRSMREGEKSAAGRHFDRALSDEVKARCRWRMAQARTYADAARLVCTNRATAALLAIMWNTVCTVGRTECLNTLPMPTCDTRVFTKGCSKP